MLVLSSDRGLRDFYSRACLALGSECECLDYWHSEYRLDFDCVVLEGSFLPKINEGYDRERLVIVLKEEEDVSLYGQLGITRYIYDTTDTRQLTSPLYIQRRNPWELLHDRQVKRTREERQMKCTDLDLVQDIFGSSVYKSDTAQVELDFLRRSYRYKGEQVYISDGQAKYLADWLLGGWKDNNRRKHLFDMRQSFGEDFLSVLDRHGNVFPDV